MGERKYNIEHRKTRTQYMLYEDQVSWIKRVYDRQRFKSESEFVTHLMSLGIQAYTKGAIENEHHRD